MSVDPPTMTTASRSLEDVPAWLRTRRVVSAVRCKRSAVMRSNSSRVMATEAAGRVADTALQIHGGYGYCKEYAVERYYRDVRVTRIYEGTSEIQRLVIARKLLAEY